MLQYCFLKATITRESDRRSLVSVVIHLQCAVRIVRPPGPSKQQQSQSIHHFHHGTTMYYASASQLVIHSADSRHTAKSHTK